MNDELNFTNQQVLVVGGSSGIGNGIARGFAEQGARVTVWGTRARAEDYSDDSGSDLTGMQYRRVDVTRHTDIRAGCQALAAVDVLVLSQGTVIYKRGEYEMDGFNRVIDLNLNSVMACCAAFVEKLEASRGRIVIIGSIAGFTATIGNPAYAASKTALVGLTRTLGAAWAGRGIRVNGIAPGLVETKLTQATFAEPKRREAALKTIPAARFGSVRDMANAALFLASPMSSFVVGQTLIADGGATLA